MELLAWERMICGPRIFGKQAEDWPPVPVPFHCVLSEFFAPKARPVCVTMSAKLSSGTVITSKRIEKREELLLLCLGQIEEVLRHVRGLALVALDRALQGQRFEVMHKPRPHAQAPKCRRAKFVRGILRPGLDDAVAGLEVMQQKIAVGMDDLVAERRRHGESPAIDARARRRRRDGLHMTDIAADPLEQGLTGSGIRPGRQVGVAWRHLRAANELSEMVDIGQT